MMKKVVLLLVVLFPLNAFASPDKTVTYLMNQPLSLFDSGMIRLNSRVEDFAHYIKNGYKNYGLGKFSEIMDSSDLDSSAEYDWDSNRIIINVNLMVRYHKTFQANQLKELSRIIIKRFKYILGYSPDYHRRVINRGFFSHQGYQMKNNPKNLMEDLDNITQIKFTVMQLNAKDFTAVSKLTSKEVFFSQ